MVEGQHPISFSATPTGPGRPAHLRDVALACFQVEPYVTSGAHLRPSGAHLRPSGAHLRPSGAHLRPCSRTASPTLSRTASLRLRSRWSRIWCWPVPARDGTGAAQVRLPPASKKWYPANRPGGSPSYYRSRRRGIILIRLLSYSKNPPDASGIWRIFLLYSCPIFLLVSCPILLLVR